MSIITQHVNRYVYAHSNHAYRFYFSSMSIITQHVNRYVYAHINHAYRFYFSYGETPKMKLTH